MTMPPSHLSALYEAIQSLGAPLAVSEALDRTLDAAIQLANAERGLGVLLGERFPVLTLRVVPEVDDETAQQMAKVMGPLAHQVKQTGQGILIPDAQDDPRFEPAATQFAARAAMLIPLRAGDEIIGAVCLDRETRTGRFTPDDLALLEMLTGLAGVTIHSAQLYEAAKRANLEFVETVVHDLRLPMTAIKGYSDLLIRGIIKTPQEERKFLAIILNNVGRMNALLGSLLDMAQIESGLLCLDIGAIDMAACLQETIDYQQPLGDQERALIAVGVHPEALIDLRARTEAKGQTLAIHLPPLPPVRADKRRLKQILTHLIDNAYRYTPTGGHITITGQMRGEFVHMAVADTGIGIKPENQRKMFTKFFRVNAPAVREHPGWGLGLYITSRLVEAMGGEIGLTSEPGRGSTFWFTLPAAVPEHEI